jgi:hypothetical protein
MICDIENTDPALEKAPKSGGLNQLIGSQPYSLESWISIGNNWISIGNNWISIGNNWISIGNNWISIGNNWISIGNTHINKR